MTTEFHYNVLLYCSSWHFTACLIVYHYIIMFIRTQPFFHGNWAICHMFVCLNFVVIYTYYVYILLLVDLDTVLLHNMSLL